MVQEFKKYIDQAHSVFHAVAGLSQMLDEAGYTRLSESENWVLEKGGKYYFTRSSSAIMAFRIPEAAPAGFMLSASHADRPTFKFKENGELTGAYTRLSTEKYGGMLIAPWLDRPLSLAGRVLVEKDGKVCSQLVDIDKDLLLIPNVAIHMNRKANEGYAWNPAVDTLPLIGGKEAAGKLDELLQEQAQGKILGHDLYLYVRQPATVWGAQDEFISAQALDDLQCAWCCTKGFLEAGESKAIPVLCVFDSEEVGSSSLQGAASRILEMTLSRICKALELDMGVMLSNSFMLSADNAHAIHPNHPEFADAKNAPVVNGGIVLKFNANQRYVTDGASAAVLRSVCKMADVPVQTYYNRADLPGGSTLGNISLAQVSVLSADIGLAQLAMHSCYETAGVKDTQYLVAALKKFYSLCLQTGKDGELSLI